MTRSDMDGVDRIRTERDGHGVNVFVRCGLADRAVFNTEVRVALETFDGDLESFAESPAWCAAWARIAGEAAEHLRRVPACSPVPRADSEPHPDCAAVRSAIVMPGTPAVAAGFAARYRWLMAAADLVWNCR